MSRGRAVTALEEERRRVRRDLHDGLGPMLTGIAYSADAVANMLRSNPDEASEIVQALRREARDAIAEIRRIVYGLRPRALDELGLVGAVQQQVSRLRTADGRFLAVAFDAAQDMSQLPAAVEVAAYRMAVEALTNVARHSGVAEASARFTLAEGPVLCVTIADRAVRPRRGPRRRHHLDARAGGAGRGQALDARRHGRSDGYRRDPSPPRPHHARPAPHVARNATAAGYDGFRTGGSRSTSRVRRSNRSSRRRPSPPPAK